jgi:hypothetical protein
MSLSSKSPEGAKLQALRPDDAEDAIEMPDPTLPFAFT